MSNVKLSDITCLITKGTTPMTLGYSYQDDGINFIKVESITEEGNFIVDKVEHISDECNKKLKRSILKENDILFSIAGALGRTAIVTKEILPANTNQALAVIRLSDEGTFTKYIQYCLKSNAVYNQFQRQKQGVAQLNLSLKNINDLLITLPPLETQKQIAKTLDTVSELLAMYKQQLVELDNLIRAVFYDMFGDPVINEKGWQFVKLGEIGELNSGGTPPRTKPGYFLGDIDWYSAGELNKRYLEKSKEKLTLEAISNSSAKLFIKGTLLIGMYDTAAFKLGILTKDSSSNQACANIRVKENIVNIEWLYDCAQIMRPYFLTNRRGIRQKNLNLGMIKNFMIPLPPITLQNQFASIVTQVEHQKSLVQKAIDETQYLLDSLMSQYFDN